MSGFSPFWFGGDPTKQSIWNPWVNQGKGEGETGECIHLRSHHARRSPPLFTILMCDFFSFSICWRLWAQSPGTQRHTQEERGWGRGENRLVHVLPHTINRHTHDFFLLSLTLGQPRSSPGDFCSIYRWGKITGSHQASNLLLFFWFQISSPRFILILFCFLTDFKLGNLKLRE